MYSDVNCLHEKKEGISQQWCKTPEYYYKINKIAIFKKIEDS